MLHHTTTPHHHSMHSMMTFIESQSRRTRHFNEVVLTAFENCHRKHCRIVARTDGAAEVQCTASQNPTNILRKVNDGATLQTLNPGGQRAHMCRATSRPCRDVITGILSKSVIDANHCTTACAGESCVIHPGDRVALLASSEYSSATEFELRMDGDNSAPSDAQPPASVRTSFQLQPTAELPPSSSDLDLTVIPRPLPHLHQDREASDAEPPLKR